MLIYKKYSVVVMISGIVAMMIISSTTYAWSCEAVYKEALTEVEKAQSMVDENTDSRVLALIQEARGMAEAGIVSHRKSNEGHTKETGKYRHSDAMTKGRIALQMAKQAKFLMTGEVY